jgi:hypothetical protein
MRFFRANIFNLYSSYATWCLQEQKKNYMHVKISINIVFFCFLFVGPVVFNKDYNIEQDRTIF